MGNPLERKSMRELWQFTTLIRSKNAGPFELTFDIMCKDRESFDRVLNSGVLSREMVAKVYGVRLEEVRFFEIGQIHAIKFSIPRRVFAGDVTDTDIYGGQFHSPLVRLLVKEDE
jgi:hypothetical protein